MTTGENTELLLRPVIARLRELEKKCDSMGSRNEEFPLMRQKLASIIKRLETGREPSGAPLPYRSIAREIFPVAHLFESVGFMSVGREIAHIQKTLNDLDPGPPAPVDEPAPIKTVEAGSSSARISTESSTTKPEPRESAKEEVEEDSPSGSSFPWPVVFAFIALLLAAGISSLLIFKIGPFRKIPPTPTPSPTAIPATATPAPLPTSPPAAVSNTRSPTVRLADELSLARLAIAREDLEGTVKHLSAAAMIDRDNTVVLEIAAQMVDRLVHEADTATEEAQWTRAEEHLERARRIAMRFGIETTAIDSAERRHAAMERFAVVSPEDTARIRAAVGKRVVVILADRNERSGRIEGLSGRVLLLEVDSDVGGGIVRFTDEIPLDTISSIRVYED